MTGGPAWVASWGGLDLGSEGGEVIASEGCATHGRGFQLSERQIPVSSVDSVVPMS